MKNVLLVFLYGLKTDFTIGVFYESFKIIQNVLNIILFFT